MKLTVQQTYDIVKPIADAYHIDPWLVVAICQQESNFDYSEARLENGFYRKYFRKGNYATTVEVLLSTSFGIMQMMGESLRAVGYFVDIQEYGSVPKRIDAYMTDPKLQIQLGVQWLNTKKMKAGGDARKMLLYWNGGGNKKYPDEVFAKYQKITGREYQ